MDFWIKTIPRSFSEDDEAGWKVQSLFRGSSRLLECLSCHHAVLGEGKIPHPPHRHPEEELIVLRSGQLDCIEMEGDSQRIERVNVSNGGGVALFLRPSTPHHPFRGGGSRNFSGVQMAACCEGARGGTTGVGDHRSSRGKRAARSSFFPGFDHYKAV